MEDKNSDSIKPVHKVILYAKKNTGRIPGNQKEYSRMR